MRPENVKNPVYYNYNYENLPPQVYEIRTGWAAGDEKRDEGLTTPKDIVCYDDISYGPHGSENLLDIYVSAGTDGLLPTIVNIHGGGWVYGCKEVYRYYCMSLAQKGFAVVNINYRLAPESHFPAPVEDINAVMTFLAREGGNYHVDKDRLILIGDSAGGQLTSHYATVWSNPEFAALFDFKVPDVTIKALGLNCGVYQTSDLTGGEGDNLFLCYIDCMDKKPEGLLAKQVDAASYMNASFPPSFVMTAECDFLRRCAEPMYRHLKGLGVPAKLAIYGAKDKPEIGHVFHVNIRLEEAQKCNEDECAFWREWV